jgi:hypothetical protein
MDDSEATTIFQAWKNFEHDVIPEQAGVVQREACRRCFYAGARALYDLIGVYAHSADATYQQVHRLHRELAAFGSDVRHGI